MNATFNKRKISIVQKNNLNIKQQLIKKQQLLFKRTNTLHPINYRYEKRQIEKNSNKFCQAVSQWRKIQRKNVVGLKTCKIKLIQKNCQETYLPTITEPQQIIIKLNKITKIPLKQSLFILESLLLGYSQIYQFLGYLCFSLSFCGITLDGKIKVWINSDFNSNIPQGQLISDQYLCVLSIMQGLKTLSDKNFQDFYFYYIRNAGKNKCGFKFTLSILKSYTKCIKIKLPQTLNLQLVHQQNNNKQKEINFNNNSTKKKQLQQIIKQQYQSNNLTSDKKNYYQRSFSHNNQSNYKKSNKILVSHQKQKQKVKNSCKKIHSISNFQTNLLTKNNQNYQNIQKTKKQNNFIINQFSLALNARQTVVNCQTASKQTENKRSQISTTQKTDSNKMKQSSQVDWNFPNYVSRKCLTHQSQNIHQNIKQSQDKQKVFNLLSLLPQKLEQVQSKGQGSDIDQMTERRRRSSQEQIQFFRKKREEIIRGNLWTNKIDDLFGNKIPTLKSSRQDGIDVKQVFLPSNTQRLDQWARMLSESLISQKV